MQIIKFVLLSTESGLVGIGFFPTLQHWGEWTAPSPAERWYKLFPAKAARKSSSQPPLPQLKASFPSLTSSPQAAKPDLGRPTGSSLPATFSFLCVTKLLSHTGGWGGGSVVSSCGPFNALGRSSSEVVERGFGTKADILSLASYC